MHDRTLALPALLAIALALAACAPATATLPAPLPTLTSGPPTPAAGSTPTWEQRWLEDSACTIPCWQGITPGHTTIDETMRLLRDNQRVTQLEVLPPKGDQPGNLHWYWPDFDTGDAFYRTEGLTQTVYYIRLTNDERKQVRLGKVIDLLGPPSHVQLVSSVSDAGYRYYLDVLYLSRGIKLWTATSAGNTPVIAPDTLLFPDFFVPAQESSVAQLGIGVRAEWLVRWNGYQDFRFYCRDEASGGLCSYPLPMTEVVPVASPGAP